MDWLTPDMLKAVLTALISGGGLYAGIRADLRGMAVRITVAQKAAEHAHARLDRHLEGHV